MPGGGGFVRYFPGSGPLRSSGRLVKEYKTKVLGGFRPAVQKLKAKTDSALMNSILEPQSLRVLGPRSGNIPKK